MKLMDIDADQLGIPDTEYDANVTMSSSELSRIMRDLAQLGESVRIEVTKDGVRFFAEGESANGNVLLKQTDAARKRYKDYGKDKEDNKDKVKKEAGGNDDEEDEEEGGSSKANGKTKIKKEPGTNDEDEEMGDAKEEEDEDEEGKAKEEDGEEEQDSDEESENRKKRKKAQATKVRK